MQEPRPLSSLEQELADSLKGLQLAPMQTSSQQIWYQAGFQVGRRRANAWRAVAGIVAVAALAVQVWAPRPAPLAVERIVYVPQGGPARATIVPPREEEGPMRSTAALRLRNAIIEDGWDAMPHVHGGADGEPPLRAGSRL